MTGRIGIVGCSAPGASLCFETICRDAQTHLGMHVHPEITINVLSFDEHVICVQSRDWDGLANMLLTSVDRLRAAHADFVICPDNTAHIVFERVAQRSALPWIHIAEVVADEAARRDYRRVGILGTRALLTSNLYDVRLAARGATPIKPEEDDTYALDALIFGELSRGVVSRDGRELLAELVWRLKSEQGCEAVVLGCTELPLLVDPKHPLPLPTLDSTRLLAQAAIQRAIAWPQPRSAQPAFAVLG